MINHIERITRTAPKEAFNGGYRGHGRILPMKHPTERKGFWKRVMGR